MRKVKVPGIYRHFKGEYYAVMAISNKLSHKILDAEILEGFHTELKRRVKIYKKDNKYYHEEDIDQDSLVLYKTLYDSSGIFLRPREMFLSEVDREKYPETKAKYRFEEK